MFSPKIVFLQSFVKVIFIVLNISNTCLFFKCQAGIMSIVSLDLLPVRLQAKLL